MHPALIHCTVHWTRTLLLASVVGQPPMLETLQQSSQIHRVCFFSATVLTTSLSRNGPNVHTNDMVIRQAHSCEIHSPDATVDNGKHDCWMIWMKPSLHKTQLLKYIHVWFQFDWQLNTRVPMCSCLSQAWPFSTSQILRRTCLRPSTVYRVWAWLKMLQLIVWKRAQQQGVNRNPSAFMIILYNLLKCWPNRSKLAKIPACQQSVDLWGMAWPLLCLRLAGTNFSWHSELTSHIGQGFPLEWCGHVWALQLIGIGLSPVHYETIHHPSNDTWNYKIQVMPTNPSFLSFRVLGIACART